MIHPWKNSCWINIGNSAGPLNVTKLCGLSHSLNKHTRIIFVTKQQCRSKKLHLMAINHRLQSSVKSTVQNNTTIINILLFIMIIFMHHYYYRRVNVVLRDFCRMFSFFGACSPYSAVSFSHNYIITSFLLFVAFVRALYRWNAVQIMSCILLSRLQTRNHSCFSGHVQSLTFGRRLTSDIYLHLVDGCANCSPQAKIRL